MYTLCRYMVTSLLNKHYNNLDEPCPSTAGPGCWTVPAGLPHPPTVAAAGEGQLKVPSLLLLLVLLSGCDVYGDSEL